MDTPEHLVKVLQGEAERLMQYLSTLPPDAWSRPSACDLWEVRDVVGHLTWMAERFRGTVSRAVRGDVSPPAGSPPVGTSTPAGRGVFIAQQAIARRESLGDQLLPTFRAQMGQFIELLAQLGPPWGAAFGQDAGLSRPVRCRWDVTVEIAHRNWCSPLGNSSTCWGLP